MTPLHQKLSSIKALADGASNGKSWIDLLQSDGCTLKLFDEKYRIFLEAKMLGDYKQTEKDAQFIAASRTIVPQLIAVIEKQRELLSEYVEGWDDSGTTMTAFDNELLKLLNGDENEL